MLKFDVEKNQTKFNIPKKISPDTKEETDYFKKSKP